MSYNGPLPQVVKAGGIGDSNLTDHGLLVGAGTSAITQLSVATTGSVLIGNTGADPSFSANPSVSTITIADAPVVGTDGANKDYVDLIAAGFQFKNACYAGTTSTLTAAYFNGVSGVGATLTNIAAFSAFSIDGLSPPINSRILIKDQSSQLENGIYTLTTVGSGAVAWILTRSTDFDQPSDIQAGDLVPVQLGTININSLWLQTEVVASVGVDSIDFNKFSSAPITTTQYDVLVGGANDTISSVGPGSSGQIFQSAGASSNPAYSTATYPSIATGTGTILRADGTNWLATTSTYPNTNTVSTLLYASASNVMSELSTANNGLLVTSNSGVPSILAGPGATGQILQSNTSAAPSFSTATYPSVATGTGTLLRADGTNWVATTSTYPTTNAVSTLLYASGTNVMGALSTANNGLLVTSNTGVPSVLAGPGTTGQMLQSNAAAAPSFSTATFPATATSAGTILRADGTNWVASTSTYPNTNAVSTLLYASASNVMSALSTANNGLLVTSNSGVPSILAGSGTTGQILQSNAAAAPSFSTATYPSTATGTGTILRANGTNWAATTATYPTTTTVSQILYSSSANVVDGLATANRGVLTTNSTGVPVVTAIATDGQIIVGSTAGSPAAATITAGDGITITNASNAITVAQTTQPGFATKLSGNLTNVTGDGTSYTVIFDSVVNQQGGTNYNNATGVFTAPSTGYYMFTYALSFTGLTASFTSGQIYLNTTSQIYRTFVINPGAIRSSGNLDLGCGVIAYMSSGNTASLITSMSGSTKTISLSTSFTTFSGFKLV